VTFKKQISVIYAGLDTPDEDGLLDQRGWIKQKAPQVACGARGYMGETKIYLWQQAR